MQAHYIEIVTEDVDGVCAAYAAMHGARFEEPNAALGNARTAALPGGGSIGVRAPMHETEEATIRPYWLVDDIQAAVQRAEESGAEIALPPMVIAGRGTIAIYIQGGVHHGLWEL